MTELDAALERLRTHDGVEHIILLGDDGLVVQQSGSPAEAEAIAARIPGFAGAAAALGSAAGRGDLATAVLEFGEGVAVIVTLSGGLLFAALLRPGVGFAPLLRDLRRERDRLVELL